MIDDMCDDTTAIGYMIDNEELCMKDGCENKATMFEESDSWHDYIWCHQHATKKSVPIVENKDVKNA